MSISCNDNLARTVDVLFKQQLKIFVFSIIYINQVTLKDEIKGLFNLDSDPEQDQEMIMGHVTCETHMYMLFIVREVKSDVPIYINRTNAGKNQMPQAGFEPTTSRSHERSSIDISELSLKYAMLHTCSCNSVFWCYGLPGLTCKSLEVSPSITACCRWNCLLISYSPTMSSMQVIVGVLALHESTTSPNQLWKSCKITSVPRMGERVAHFRLQSWWACYEKPWLS